MEFSLTQDFPAALQRLWHALAQPDYPERKYRALGALDVRIERFDATPQTIEVALERDLPVDRDRLPPWARPFVGRTQTLRHTSRWRRLRDDEAQAELEIAPVGLPVHAHGRGSVNGTSANATRLTLHWQVESSVPVLRDRVERLFADQVRAAMEEDHAFTVHYLQRHAPL
jgi:hypothetical protein